MSMQTWLQEFYPVPACDLINSSPLEQAEHALLKWTGVLPENLAKHNIAKYICDNKIGDAAEQFRLITDVCVWCLKYYYSRRCDGCPLNHVNCLMDNSVYLKWMTFEDPIPMIEEIKKVVENERRTQE